MKNHLLRRFAFLSIACADTQIQRCHTLLPNAQPENGSKYPPQAFCTEKVTKCPNAHLLPLSVFGLTRIAQEKNPVKHGIYSNIGQNMTYKKVNMSNMNAQRPTERFCASGLYRRLTMIAKNYYFCPLENV